MSADDNARQKIIDLATSWLDGYSVLGEDMTKPPEFFQNIPGGMLLWLRVGQLNPEIIEIDLSHEEWSWAMQEVLDEPWPGGLLA